VETDILPLMSALLVLIVLLPMIPALIGNHLQDIFEVFRYNLIVARHVEFFTVGIMSPVTV
jgi:Hamartin protein.